VQQHLEYEYALQFRLPLRQALCNALQTLGAIHGTADLLRSNENYAFEDTKCKSRPITS
ncbi:uncharacterized protein METZ01_LOCUS244413, partial [marine metagenome]